jgi:hypothetical protein
LRLDREGRSFAANAARLQLHALAHNLRNFPRTLATPEPIKDWSLTSQEDKLIRIGAKAVSRCASANWLGVSPTAAPRAYLD